MEFDWVMGWFVGPKFFLCDGLGWVGLGQSFGGLGWVEKIRPTDNSDCDQCGRAVKS